jgi:hypothetical protein
MLLGLAGVVHALELPGMLGALRGHDGGSTVYR